MERSREPIGSSIASSLGPLLVNLFAQLLAESEVTKVSLWTEKQLLGYNQPTDTDQKTNQHTVRVIGKAHFKQGVGEQVVVDLFL